MRLSRICLARSIGKKVSKFRRKRLTFDFLPIEQLLNRFLHLLRLRSRLFGFGNRTAHDDVVRPAHERLFRRHGSLLIVADGQIGKGPDARRDDEKLAAQRLAQLGGFQAGGNDAVATQGERPFGAG